SGAMFLMSAAAIIPCALDNFSGWASSRLIMGIAGAAVLPLSIHLLTLATSGPQLVKGLSIAISGWGFGITLAMLGAAPLLHLIGWRAVMLGSAALGLVVIVGLYWALPSQDVGGEAASRSPPLVPLARMLCSNYALNMMSIINAAATSVMICVPA